MTLYKIYNAKTGVELGMYEAADASSARDAMVADAGYSSYEAACKVSGGGGDLVVEEVTRGAYLLSDDEGADVYCVEARSAEEAADLYYSEMADGSEVDPEDLKVLKMQVCDSSTDAVLRSATPAEIVKWVNDRIAAKWEPDPLFVDGAECYLEAVA